MKIKDVGKTYLSKLKGDEGKYFSILLEKFPIKPPEKEGDDFCEHYFLEDKDITKISFKEFIGWINWINYNFYSFKDKFLAIKILQFHYQLLSEPDYDKNYLIKKFIEERFDNASIDVFDYHNPVMFQLFKMELKINKKEDIMMFGGYKEKIYTSDKLTITAGTNGKLVIKSSNQNFIVTDTNEFEVFFDGDDGYIKEYEDYKWTHFKKGEDPVKSIVYDSFETVDHFFI